MANFTLVKGASLSEIDSKVTAAQAAQAGAEAAKNAAAASASIAQSHSGLPGSSAADFRMEDALVIWCGDSTTEQAGGAGYAESTLKKYRVTGAALDGVVGTINFGGSGYTLNGFISDAANGAFVGPTIGAEVGVGSWDSWFHKPSGSVSQATALAWRNQYDYRTLWVLCYGINDLILYAATGNLTQAEITDYIATRLDTAVKAFLVNNPQDFVVLRIPNPMTARPFLDSGFPSSTAYPTFGGDDATDQALVEKWNQGLRAAYLAVAGRYDRTALLDTWSTVFGPSDTTVSASDNPMMGDLVHPSGEGYRMTAHEFVQLMTGRASNSGLEKKAKLVNSAAPWTVDPEYLRDNPDWSLRVKASLVGIGSTYIDLGIGADAFNAAVNTGKAVLVDIDGYGVQSFSGVKASSSAANTRLTGVSPSAALQAASGSHALVRVFQDGRGLVADDIYVTAQTRSGYRAVYPGAVLAAGSGFVRVEFKNTVGRPFGFFDDGFLRGKLIIGGDAQTVIDLSDGWAEVQLTGEAQRQFNKTGDWSAYSGEPCAVAVSKALPYESARISGTTDASPGTSTAFAHGLGYTPNRVVLTPRGAATVYQSAVSDSTNIYVASTGASILFNAYVS